MKKQVWWYLPAALAAVCLPPPAVARVYAPAVREMTERRSATERHYLLADGAYRAEVHGQPIHYKAPDGTWQPIDTRLATSLKPGFAVANESNTLRTFLPENARGWVRVEAGACAASFQLLGALNGNSTIQSDSVEFANAGTNLSITYSVAPGQLKELITLSAPGTVPALRYRLALDGLTTRVNPDNSVGLIDSTGNASMRITAPWMKDASGKYSGRIKVAVTETAEGLVYSMEPDAEWLASAHYPVTIDPTITTVWTAVNSTDEYQRDSFWTSGIDSESTPPDTGTSLAVGASGVSYGPYRSLLSFSITGLPLDSEIEESTLTLYAESSSGSPNMQVQIYHINKDLDPNGVSGDYPTPNNIGYYSSDYSQRAILSVYPSVTVPLEPNFWGTNKTFDVTGLVQSWADDRSTDLNLMLRDTQEDIAPWLRSSATVFFTAEESALTLEYTVPGWYMLQGNNRHSGATQYPLASSAENLQSSFGPKWTTELVTESSELPSNYPGSQFVPSIVAVPNYAIPPTGLPVLYLPVNDKRIASEDVLSDNTTMQWADSGHTRIWRIEDTGPNFSQKGFDLADLGTNTDLQVTGTPIVIGTTLENSTPGHKLVLAGISRTVDANGAINGSQGHVMRIDVTGQGQNAAMSLKWHYVFDVDDLGQGVFASPGYWFGTTSYKSENGQARSYTGGVILVPVHKGDAVTQNDGDYLIALALDTNNSSGKNVWGYVDDTTGQLVYHLRGSGQLATTTWGGLPPLLSHYWTEDSSPAVSVCTQRSYATANNDPGAYDGTGGVVSRDIRTGEPPFEGDWFTGDGSIRAQTVAVAQDRFYTGRTGYFNGWLDEAGAVSSPALLAQIDTTSANLGSVFAVPAFYTKNHIAIAGCYYSPNLDSRLIAVATNNSSANLLSAPMWTTVPVTGVTRGAPIVTGTLGSFPLACLTTSIHDGPSVGDSRTDVFCLIGVDQGLVKRSLSGLEGFVCGNEAAFGASITGCSRLYVVTGGIQQTMAPAFANAVQLTCFAQ